MHLNKKFTIKQLRTWLREFNDIKHNHSYKKILSSDYDARKVIFFWLWCNTPSLLEFDNKPWKCHWHYCFVACVNMKIGTDPRLNRKICYICEEATTTTTTTTTCSELEFFWKW